MREKGKKRGKERGNENIENTIRRRYRERERKAGRIPSKRELSFFQHARSGYGEMFRCTTRPLIDNRRSAHGRFARAYKRAAHASMETIAVYLDRPHTRTWVRRRDERVRESEEEGRRRENWTESVSCKRASERERKIEREGKERKRKRDGRREGERRGGRKR